MKGKASYLFNVNRCLVKWLMCCLPDNGSGKIREIGGVQVIIIPIIHLFGRSGNNHGKGLAVYVNMINLSALIGTAFMK